MVLNPVGTMRSVAVHNISSTGERPLSIHSTFATNGLFSPNAVDPFHISFRSTIQNTVLAPRYGFMFTFMFTS